MKNLVDEITNTKQDTLEHYRNSITRSRYVSDINHIRELAKRYCARQEPSDTDYNLLRKLAGVYKPAVRGIVTNDERDLICETLEFPARNVRDLINLRNMVVMCGTEVFGGDFDPVSAITHVIDEALIKLGSDI